MIIVYMSQASYKIYIWNYGEHESYSELEAIEHPNPKIFLYNKSNLRYLFWSVILVLLYLV